MRRSSISVLITTMIILVLILTLLSGCGFETAVSEEESVPVENVPVEIVPADVESNTEETAVDDKDMEALAATGRTQYTADLSVSRPESMEDFVYVKGSQRITFRNDSDDIWDHIVLREYSPSILKDEVFLLSVTGRERPYEPGEVQHTAIESVSRDGTELAFEEQSDPSVVSITLNEPLKPGEACAIELTFNIRVASSPARQGYDQVDSVNKDDVLDSGEIIVSLGPVLPVLAEYKDGEWVCHEYFEDGECFISECSDYHVTLNVPDGFRAVASGKETVNDDGTYTIQADNMRDFAVIAGDTLNYVEDRYGDKTVRVWFYDNGNDVYKTAAGKALEIAIDAVRTFTDYYGEYAYDELDVVFAPYHHEGMEYPGMVRIADLECLISSDADDSGEGDEMYRAFRTNIVHEIAHEWFYAAVGNDSFSEPWLDEGFARYSEIVFMEENGLQQSADSFISSLREHYAAADNAPVDISVDESSVELSEGQGSYVYGWTVYDGSALFLHELKETMGKEKFDEFMHRWYSENTGSIVTTGQFFKELFETDDSDDVHQLVSRFFREKSYSPD